MFIKALPLYVLLCSVSSIFYLSSWILITISIFLLLSYSLMLSLKIFIKIIVPFLEQEKINRRGISSLLARIGENRGPLELTEDRARGVLKSLGCEKG